MKPTTETVQGFFLGLYGAVCVAMIFALGYITGENITRADLPLYEQDCSGTDQPADANQDP